MLDYYTKFSGFLDNIGKLELPKLGSATTVRMENYNGIIIQINQAITKPDGDVSLMSNFQVKYNVTIFDTSQM